MTLPDAPREARIALAEGMIEAGAAMELSSLHITFLSGEEADLLATSAVAGSAVVHAVPLAQSGLSGFRCLSGHHGFTQAQDHPPRTPQLAEPE